MRTTMMNEDWYVDIENAKAYQEKLNKGELKPGYFSGGKNAQIEKDLFENHIGTTKNTIAMNRIYEAMGIIRRYLTDCPIGIDEIVNAKGKKRKYLSGDGDFEFGAWAFVQSYLLGGMTKPNMLRSYYPLGCSKDVINKWNACICRIDGLDNTLRAMFMIDSNGDAAVLAYINAWADDYGLRVDERTPKDRIASSYPSKDFKMKKKSDSDNVADNQTATNDTANTNNQDDDVKSDNKNTGTDEKTESKNDDVVERIRPGAIITHTDTSKNIKKKPKDTDTVIDPAEKEHPEDDTPVAKDAETTDSEVATSVTLETVAEKEESAKSDDEKIDLKAKAEIKIPVTFMPGKSSKMPFVKFDVGEQSKVNLSANDQIDNIYKEANDIWEQAFPGLDKITSLIHKAGFYVNYMVNPAFDTQRVFNADIISKEGVWLRSFLIDYYCITHDAIRIGFLTDPTGDVFSGIWVSSYQKHENLALKMITGTLTEEDIKKIISKYPENIRLVSRMVDLEEIPDDIPYPKWRALVNRIANVVQNMPAHARFRLVNYKSATDWTLACARNVNISFINKNDPRTRDINFNTTREKGLFVDYSEEKYKDYNGYIVGFTDGSDLPFDPYANLDKDNKKVS